VGCRTPGDAGTSTSPATAGREVGVGNTDDREERRSGLTCGDSEAWLALPSRRDPHTSPCAGERHIDHLGIYVRGFETSPYGIEWIRFEPHCRVPEVVRTVPHIAFAVDDLDEALKGKEVLIAPNAPSAGVRVAFILDDGAPVELLQFQDISRAGCPTPK